MGKQVGILGDRAQDISCVNIVGLVAFHMAQHVLHVAHMALLHKTQAGLVSG